MAEAGSSLQASSQNLISQQTLINTVAQVTHGGRAPRDPTAYRYSVGAGEPG